MGDLAGFVQENWAKRHLWRGLASAGREFRKVAYTFAGVDPRVELDRLRRIEAIFDGGSVRLLEAAGIRAGARCLEMGAGAGSMAAWLGKHVGDAGEVVAVDLDTSFLRSSLAEASNVRWVEGEARQVLRGSAFDLIHARYVLVHNSDWEALLDAALDALEPGGVIALEEPDFTVARAAAGADAGPFDRVNAAICAMFRTAAREPSLGIRLPGELARRGLRVERVENDAPLCRGRDPVAAMMAASTEQLRGKYVATGLVTEVDIEGYLRFAADAESWGVYYGTVRALARKGV